MSSTQQQTPTAKLAEIAQQSLALTSFIAATATSSGKPQRDPFDLYTDQELMNLVHEIDDRKKWMEIESRLYDRFLMKAGRGGARGGSGKPGKSDSGQTSSQSQQQQNSAKKEIHPDCSVTVKIDIVNKEMEELKDEQARTVAQFDKECANLLAQLEELTQRKANIQKAAHDFKRDIEHAAFNPRSKRVMAERVMRYFEDNLQNMDNTIEKTRLKNQSLLQHRARILIQLRQKEETGEVLQAIDYDQLSIENQQYQQKIEEKNHELVQLKGACAHTISALTTQKQKLSELVREHDTLVSDIRSRQELMKKLTAESSMVQDETGKVDTHNQLLTTRMEEYRVPSVMDYIGLKAKQQELEAQVSAWKRKVDVQRMNRSRVLKEYQEIFPPTAGAKKPETAMSESALLPADSKQQTVVNPPPLSIIAHSAAPTPAPRE